MESWAAAGGGGNDVYLGNRLRYETDQNADKIFRGETDSALWALFGIVTSGTILALLIAVVAFVLGATPFTNSTYCSGSGSSALCIPSGSGAPSPAILLPFLGYVIAAIWPRRSWASQWQLMLDGKAEASDTAYATIAGSLKDHKIPAGVKTRRVRSSVGGTVRNYLIVGGGRYTAYVGVFPFGTNLYMTWSMWRRISYGRVLLGGIGNALASVFMRNTEFHRVIRTDPDRAFREAIHNATREGIEAAVSGVELKIEEVLGDIPIELESQPAPQAAAAAAAPVSPVSPLLAPVTPIAVSPAVVSPVAAVPAAPEPARARPAAPPKPAVPPRPALPPRPAPEPPAAPVQLAPVAPGPAPVPVSPVLAAAPGPAPEAIGELPTLVTEATTDCPVCGRRGIPWRTFCLSCGASLPFRS